MMYTEMLALTDNLATYEQYLDIEAIYMKKDSMTKEQAAKLWQRRYGPKKERPRPAELKEFKTALRDLVDNRDMANYDAAQVKQKCLEEIQRLQAEASASDVVAYVNGHLIEKITKRMPAQICGVYEAWGNDSTFHIIYKDGTEAVAFGDEIVSGEVNLKMQHIAYAYYLDGYVEYDTLIGEFPWWICEEDEADTREEYFTAVQLKYNTAWAKRARAKKGVLCMPEPQYETFLLLCVTGRYDEAAALLKQQKESNE